MSKAAERIPVITAFLYSGDKVALVKRSQDVSTYKGFWAGFSGYAERLPLNQAWLELWEEAGVEEHDIELCGIGAPLPIDDTQTDSKWLVMPFLFRLADGVEMRTNWETEELQWSNPADIARLQAVLGLNRALKSVWPAFGDAEFWEGLAHIATNIEDGATELARRGIEVLGGYVQAYEEKLDRHILMRAIRALGSVRPGMGVFPDLAARIMLAVDRENGMDSFDELLDELTDMLEDATDLCVNEAAKGLHGIKRVFTLSRSEAVTDTILTWHTEDSEVIVAESGPRNEGVSLAEYLGDHGVATVTVQDSEIECAVKGCDAVLVGCDAITPDGFLLNKVGTATAVSAAQKAGVPAYAVAQTFKIVPPDWQVIIERQAPSDYDESSTEFVGPEVFDLTPLSAFDAVFTEEGKLTGDRLAEIRAELSSVELIPGA